MSRKKSWPKVEESLCARTRHTRRAAYARAQKYHARRPASATQKMRTSLHTNIFLQKQPKFLGQVKCVQNYINLYTKTTASFCQNGILQRKSNQTYVAELFKEIEYVRGEKVVDGPARVRHLVALHVQGWHVKKKQ